MSLINSYDTEGNRTREEVYGASGSLKKYQDMAYDNENRLWKVISPDGSYTESLYDGSGNRTSFKDGKGNVTSYAHDPLDRMTQVVQPAPKAGFTNISTSYAYDINDNVTSITDGNGHATVYVYDDPSTSLRAGSGRLVEVNSPDTGTTRYEYDAAGNLIKKVDAKGVETDYEYDELNRLTAVRYPADHTRDITYSYDSGTNGIGRLTGMTDPSGTTAYFYDEYGEVRREEKVFAGLAGKTFTTAYSYDANGNLESVTYPDNRTVHFEYDDADAVTRVWTEKPGTATKDLARDAAHAPFSGLLSYAFGNGLMAERRYGLEWGMAWLGVGEPNVYRYAGGNPINFIDLLGLHPINYGGNPIPHKHNPDGSYEVYPLRSGQTEGYYQAMQEWAYRYGKTMVFLGGAAVACETGSPYAGFKFYQLIDFIFDSLSGNTTDVPIPYFPPFGTVNPQNAEGRDK